MQEKLDRGSLVARCIVCRGDIHDNQPYEVWEGGFYCEIHSLPHLRSRAREYAKLIRQEARDSRG
ncbi:MAG: hypothetical protein ACRDFX_01290 [Chloroflexota bacterium]